MALDEVEESILALVQAARDAGRRGDSRAALLAAAEIAEKSNDAEAAAAVRTYAVGVLRRAVAMGDGGDDTKLVHLVAAALERLDGAHSCFGPETEAGVDQDVLGPATDVHGARALRMTKAGGGSVALKLPRELLSHQVRIAEGACVGIGSGGKIWGGGLVMAAALCCARDVVRGLNILELGSGTGITGIIAASLGARSVVLSDGVPRVLEDLRRSCELSREAIAEGGAEVSVSYLNWNDEDVKQDADLCASHKPFDLVLASDIIYRAESTPAMARTMARFSGKSLLLQAIRNWRLIAAFVADVIALGGSVSITRLPPVGLDSTESDSVEDAVDLSRFAATFPDGGSDHLRQLTLGGEGCSRPLCRPEEVEDYAGSMVLLRLSWR